MAFELIKNPEVGGLVVAQYFEDGGKGGLRNAAGRILTVSKDFEKITFFCILNRITFKCESVDENRRWRSGRNFLMIRYPNEKETVSIIKAEELYEAEKIAKALEAEAQAALAPVLPEEPKVVDDVQDKTTKPKKAKAAISVEVNHLLTGNEQDAAPKKKSKKSAMAAAATVNTNDYEALMANPSSEVIWAYKQNGKIPHECLCGCKQRVPRFFAPGHDMRFKTNVKNMSAAELPVNVTPFYQALRCVVDRPDLLAKFLVR